MSFFYEGLTKFVDNLSQDRKAIKYSIMKKSYGIFNEIF